MQYPKSVKEIKNLNEFIRKAKELETDKYWQDQLSECTLAKNDSWWTRKESPLKWKRQLIQQYLDYKNNKLNECKLIEMKQAPLYDLTNRLDKVKGVTNKHFRNSKHWPKRFKRELDFDYNNSHIRVIDTQMGTFRIFINNDPQINKNNSKFTLDFYDLDEVIDYIINNKLEEKAVIDWNNYLTPKEVKKFLSKDDKNENAEAIIYSKEFEPRYKDLHNPLQAKYKNSWTRKELVNDLADFYYQGNLITESENKLIKRIPEKQKHKVKDFYKDAIGQYTIDLNDGYETSYGTNYIQCKTIKDCLYELKNFVDKKLEESNENKNDERVNKYIEENTNKLIGLKELAEKVRVYISTVGRKFNKAKYDYERNNYKRQQEFYRQVLAEINRRLNKTESKHKLEEYESKRNSLLAKTKAQTITRYKKSEEYKGFYIYDIDTSNLFSKDSPLLVTCKVGNYHSQVEIQNILYWVEYEIDGRNHDLQVTSKYVTQALMDAIDGMNIKVNCECGDWIYRMAYQATKYNYKYGRPENRPAKITNPKDLGALCKHLTSMLSNKKWLQQVTSTLMDFIIDNIDKVNQFLRRNPGEEFITPDEELRRRGKQASYSKFISRQEALQEIANDFIKATGNKLFTSNINLDDDLQRFINDNYAWQKVTPNEFKVLRILIDNYIKENNTEEVEDENTEGTENQNEEN